MLGHLSSDSKFDDRIYSSSSLGLCMPAIVDGVCCMHMHTAAACAVQVLVVKKYEAITRLRGIAQQNKFPIPGMLADSLIQVRFARQQRLACSPSPTWHCVTRISSIWLAAVSSTVGKMQTHRACASRSTLPSAGVPTRAQQLWCQHPHAGCQ
jgi:hypothetical protein